MMNSRTNCCEHLFSCISILLVLVLYYCIIVIVAIVCPLPPSIFNATNNVTSQTEQLAFDDVIVYTCVGGNRFADGYVTQISQCTESGTWSDVISDCRRKFVYVTKCTTGSAESTSKDRYLYITQ